VRLRAGDLVPADTTVVDGQVLVDQSALTGESLPVEVERGGRVYAGSTARRGEATGEITATGPRTAYGKTAELVRAARIPGHLEMLIAAIVQYLVAIDLVLVAAVLVYGVAADLPMAEILPFALIILIASIPVALPATFALATAIGSVELAGRGVLMTRPSAIEEAAQMDVLCVDKTGTLTQNQPTLMALFPSPPHTDDELLRVAALGCDEATQDPVDLAILAAAQARQLRADPAERLRTIPFDPATRRSGAVLSRGSAGAAGDHRARPCGSGGSGSGCGSHRGGRRPRARGGRRARRSHGVDRLRRPPRSAPAGLQGAHRAPPRPGHPRDDADR